jgi:hypothetical protein
MLEKGPFDRLSKKIYRTLVPDSPIPFEVLEHAELLFPDLYSQKVRLDQLSWKWGDLDREAGLTLLCSLAAVGYTPVVEFGTFRGRTTYNLALNCDSDIYTIDLGSPRNAGSPPGEAARANGGNAKSVGSLRVAVAERVSEMISTFKYGEYVTGEVFLNAPDDIRKRIHQRLGDSRSLDLSDLYGKAGLVIIDGGHTYDMCMSDSLNAFKLIRPGGLVLWDDYDPYFPGLRACVDELSRQRTFYYLRKEQFVVYGKERGVAD